MHHPQQSHQRRNRVNDEEDPQPSIEEDHNNHQHHHNKLHQRTPSRSPVLRATAAPSSSVSSYTLKPLDQSSGITNTNHSNKSNGLFYSFIFPLFLCIGIIGIVVMVTSIASMIIEANIKRPITVLAPTIQYGEQHNSDPEAAVHRSAIITPGVDYRIALQPSALDPSQLVHPDVAHLIEQSHHDTPLIPDIAHFVIGATHSSASSSSSSLPSSSSIKATSPPFLLQHWLALKSAKHVGGIGHIYCHVVNNEPQGEWWNKAKPLCDKIIYVRDIVHIFGRPVYHAQHKSDILRLEALLQYGGIAIDLDTICVQPFYTDENMQILTYKLDMVLGLTQSTTRNWADRFDTAIIAARSSSSFLTEWYYSYKHFDITKTPIERTEKTDDGLKERRYYQHSLQTYSSLLAWTLSVLRPHELTQLTPQIWGWPYATEEHGMNVLYHVSGITGPAEPITQAIHLWQSETQQRVEIVDLKTNTVLDVENHIDPKLSTLFNVDSITNVCLLAKSSLYGKILARAMTAGNVLEYKCAPDT